MYSYSAKHNIIAFHVRQNVFSNATWEEKALSVASSRAVENPGFPAERDQSLAVSSDDLDVNELVPGEANEGVRIKGIVRKL